MGSRRLNLTRWTPYIDECLYDLERSDESLPSDKTLCQWVKLQRLADDLGTQISTDDISYAGVSDPKIQYALKGFERQMTDWKKQKPTQVTSCKIPALLFLSYSSCGCHWPNQILLSYG